MPSAIFDHMISLSIWLVRQLEPLIESVMGHHGQCFSGSKRCAPQWVFICMTGQRYWRYQKSFKYTPLQGCPWKVTHEPQIHLIPASPNNYSKCNNFPNHSPQTRPKSHERNQNRTSRRRPARPRHPRHLHGAAPPWPNRLQCPPLQTKGCPARAQTQARPESPGGGWVTAWTWCNQ